MGLGGPVWHASIMPRVPMNPRTIRKLADKVLAGVGDARIGEWEENNVGAGGAFHLRRRLSLMEAERVGPVVDVRGTDEARRRAELLGPRLAHAPAEVLFDELARHPQRKKESRGAPRKALDPGPPSLYPLSSRFRRHPQRKKTRMSERDAVRQLVEHRKTLEATRREKAICLCPTPCRDLRTCPGFRRGNEETL